MDVRIQPSVRDNRARRSARSHSDSRRSEPLYADKRLDAYILTRHPFVLAAHARSRGLATPHGSLMPQRHNTCIARCLFSTPLEYPCAASHHVSTHVASSLSTPFDSSTDVAVASAVAGAGAVVLVIDGLGVSVASSSVQRRFSSCTIPSSDFSASQIATRYPRMQQSQSVRTHKQWNKCVAWCAQHTPSQDLQVQSVHHLVMLPPTRFELRVAPLLQSRISQAQSVLSHNVRHPSRAFLSASSAQEEHTCDSIPIPLYN